MELITTQPLCYIIDNGGTRHYKECTLEDLQEARKQKLDISCHDEILTHFDISKY